MYQAIQLCRKMAGHKLSPVVVAFLGSFVLSYVEIAAKLTPNNDGMLYVEAAQAFQQGGIYAAKEIFNWPFFSVLIGLLSSLLSVDTEFAGYLLSATLLASTCALLVAISAHITPGAGWTACLLTFAIPSLTGYRGAIIREFGTWCFICLSVYLLIRWRMNQRPWQILLAQAVTIAAAAFRPESLIFLAAYPVWYLLEYRAAAKFKELFLFTLAPGLATIGVFGLLVSGNTLVAERLGSQLLALNPLHPESLFSKAVLILSDNALSFYSADEAGLILGFGLLAIPITKLISCLGIFSVALLAARKVPKDLWQHPTQNLLLVMACMYLAVLVAFLFQQLFLTSRYAALLSIFVLPTIVACTYYLAASHKRLAQLATLVIVCLVIASAIQRPPGKPRVSQAAEWLKANPIPVDQLYSDAGEVTYLAGYGTARLRSKLLSDYRDERAVIDREKVAEALRNGKIKLAILNVPGPRERYQTWADANQLKLVKEFSDKSGKAIIVLSRN